MLALSAVAKMNTGILNATDGDWSLTDTKSAAAIVLGYLVALAIGSFVMAKARLPASEPYALKFLYNASQIVICSYLTVEGLLIAHSSGYSFMSCNQGILFSERAETLAWLFYLIKIWDFWDSFFIIAAKKWKRLSFLHVYHHACSILMSNGMLKIENNVEYIPTVVVNSFVHTVMYTYYFVCMHTKDPKTGTSIPVWWKKSLTMLQIFQFAVLITQLIIFPYKCDDPLDNATLMGRNVGIFWYISQFYLFMQFFRKAYTKEKAV